MASSRCQAAFGDSAVPRVIVSLSCPLHQLLLTKERRPLTRILVCRLPASSLDAFSPRPLKGEKKGMKADEVFGRPILASK